MNCYLLEWEFKREIWPASIVAYEMGTVYMVRKLLKKNHLKPALELCSRILEEDEVNHLARLEKAVILVRMGKTEQALEEYDKLISIDPEYYPAYIFRAELSLLEDREINEAHLLIIWLNSNNINERRAALALVRWGMQNVMDETRKKYAVLSVGAKASD